MATGYVLAKNEVDTEACLQYARAHHIEVKLSIVPKVETSPSDLIGKPPSLSTILLQNPGSLFKSLKSFLNFLEACEKMKMKVIFTDQKVFLSQYVKFKDISKVIQYTESHIKFNRIKYGMKKKRKKIWS